VTAAAALAAGLKAPASVKYLKVEDLAALEGAEAACP
jgi:hypothetical protein